MPNRANEGAIERLTAGLRGFRRRYYERQPEDMRRLVEEGQKPEVLMIGCSDSRVDPAILTRATPGELFIVRNVANLVPPYQPDANYHGTSAAIEFAVRSLNVGHIVVLGHAQCGGIRSLLRLRAGETVDGDFIAPWVSIANDACDRYVPPEAEGQAGAAERAGVRGSLDNLMTFPFVRERVEEGRLRLHGWWFDLESGELWEVNSQTGAFIAVDRPQDA
jgi:carbonic anhydrase